MKTGPMRGRLCFLRKAKHLNNAGITEMTNMDAETRQRLVDLGPEKLADALLELTRRGADLVERLVATPEENIKRFKGRLAGLKRAKRFIRWRDSAAARYSAPGLLTREKPSHLITPMSSRGSRQ